MTRRVLSEKLEGGGYITKAWSATEAEAAAVEAACRSVPPALAFIPALSKGPPIDSYEGPPPNCDGLYGYAEPTPGEILAHAQHEAAIDGDDCSGTTCLLTRGSD